MGNKSETGHPENTAIGAPLVSVIIPSFNTAEFIAETLDSVFSQTFRDYEVIVINDGSPDSERLEDVLDPYSSRITYIRQENKGPSAARNAGIRCSRGKYIALLDSDDVWEPDYLATQIEVLEEDSSIDVLYPNAVLFGASPRAGRTFMEFCPSEGEVTFRSLVEQRCNVFVSATARRESILRAGLFDEDLRASEDFELWLRMVKQGGLIKYHRKALVRYRVREGSLSSDRLYLVSCVLRVLDKAEATMELDDLQRRAIEVIRSRAIAVSRFYEGKRAFSEGNIQEAINAISEANSHVPRLRNSLILFFLHLAPRLLLQAYRLKGRYLPQTSTGS